MSGDNPLQTSHIDLSEKAVTTPATALPHPPRPSSPRAGMTTLILLTALSSLPVNMILPSLPGIAETFQADFALVSLSVAGYAIVTALTNIVAGAISDRYGRRPVALTALAIFIVASIGCALAPNIGLFLLFRAMQASISACFSVALVLIKETSPEGKATSRIGYLAMGWAIAPMVGPMFGGLLDELWGWRAIFIVLAILGAIVLALSMRGIRGGSPRSNTGYLASYRQLLGSARFWTYTLCMAFSMGTLYVFLGGAPLAVGQLLGGSAAQLGFYMGLVPAGFIFGSYLAGRTASRSRLGSTLIVARLLTCIGLSAGLILSISDVTHILAFFGPCIFIGIGNGLTMPAANTGVLSVRADLAGTAAGLAATISIAGGALIVAVTGLFHHQAGAIHSLFAMLLIPASLALLAAVSAAFVDRRASGPGS